MQKHKAHTTQHSILADMLTPVAIYMRLRDKYPGSILLESNEYGERSNSYSFICCNPIAQFSITDQTVESHFPDGTIQKDSLNLQYDLTTHLSQFKDSFEYQPNDLPFPNHGLFGYLAYDTVQLFENLEFRFRESENNIPIVHYQVFQHVMVFDHYHNRLHVFEHLYNNKESKMKEIISIIKHKDVAQYGFKSVGNETSEMSDDDFKNLVEKGKEHCKRGDVFQMVLSRKFSQDFQGDDFNVYRELRAINPSPYLFYFDYGNYRIFGSSPEAQLIIKNDHASIQPIAGTYKRTGNDIADLNAAETLKKDPKENAEHIMLVDLARNDLSRHARKVNVSDYQNIHFYSHVIHMVSKVTGVINEKDKISLIGDTFPAGTLSGAPKYKAMQLIDRYENSRRSFYGGAIGYLGFDGNFNHAIIIRSILSQGKTLNFRAGAGVVVHSDINNETQEVYNKTNALRSAINQANNN